MFLSRALFMASRLQQQQRSMSSQQKLTYHWRPIPGKVPARSSNTKEQIRPPLLLVKSFYNLRHMNTDYEENMSRVMDELSFRPHRILFIEFLKFPSKRPIKMDSIVDGKTKDTKLSDTEFPSQRPIKMDSIVDGKTKDTKLSDTEFPSQRTIKMDSIVDGKTKDTKLSDTEFTDPVTVAVQVPVPES